MGEDYAKKAVGFYWTLPVPWAGFQSLPAVIDEAAKASRTIAYQRTLIRRWAGENCLTLIHEEAFLEIEPDRGSAMILEPLWKVERLCRAEDAMLLYVDFSIVHNWRGHNPLQTWAERTRIEVLPIPAEPVDGFDPHEHFSNWRKQQDAWRSGADERRFRALARAKELKLAHHNASSIANQLNVENLPTPTGKPWTADNVRKLLQSDGA